MDGINGLMTTQTLWVAICLAIVYTLDGQAGWSLLCVAIAAAAAGFLPFNFPRARIFMGDVGSGGLGFALGALAVHCHATGAADAWTLVLIASVPLLDAGLTLAHRMLRRRDWYTAHREHLYQWLVRSDFSHARVTTIYALWLGLVLTPLLLTRALYGFSQWLSLLGLGLGTAAWVGARRYALHRVRSRPRS
jgi:UDP-N-acetylmuramyl pentapeptide phosphotransferase/UDP-N-acetylglucosamine-1-phosphate transferase